MAEVLRGYGARAVAVRGMTFTALKREVAEGRPVIAWVTGHVTPGKGIPYEVDGRTVTVAAYEHTVIVIGYNDQKKAINHPGWQASLRAYLRGFLPFLGRAGKHGGDLGGLNGFF